MEDPLWTQPAIASRRGRTPAAGGSWLDAGTASINACRMKGGVGSTGSPMEKSKLGSSSARICRARSWKAASGYPPSRASTGFMPAASHARRVTADLVSARSGTLAITDLVVG